MFDFVNDIVEFAKQQYNNYGYWIVFLGALLENTIILGLFLPGGTLVILGAVNASTGTLSIWWVVLLGWLGLFLGNITDYWLGRLGLYNLIVRLPIHKTLQPHMDTAHEFLKARGAVAISVSMFLGGIRSFVMLTCGTVKFPFWKFVLYQIPASFVWNAIYCLLGYFLAESVGVDNIVTLVGVVIAVMVVMGYMGMGLQYKLMPKKAAPADGETEISSKEEEIKPATPEPSESKSEK
jgi:membrane protein DedA with SNARE-associated domain